MNGLIRFTGGADNSCDIVADLAMKVMRDIGAALIAPRAAEPIKGELSLYIVAKMADMLGFQLASLSNSTYSTQLIRESGRQLHKVLWKIMTNNPDTSIAKLSISYEYIARTPAYSADFMALRHAVFMNLVARSAPIEEEDLTLSDCIKLIERAGKDFIAGRGVWK